MEAGVDQLPDFGPTRFAFPGQGRGEKRPKAQGPAGIVTDAAGPV
jgi:hypothetical protein